eukprot:4726481-Prymnesium_polylepis.1
MSASIPRLSSLAKSPRLDMTPGWRTPICALSRSAVAMASRSLEASPLARPSWRAAWRPDEGGRARHCAM